MTAVVAFAILALQTRGYRRFELAIAGLPGIVCLGFLYDVTQVSVNAGALAGGCCRASTAPTPCCWLSASSGHVVYLHSALTQDRIPARDDAERAELLRFERLDVVVGHDPGRRVCRVPASGPMPARSSCRDSSTVASRCSCAAVTMTPALIVLALALDATSTLVVSQVVLSFEVSFALVPMILLTCRADVMGTLVNRGATTVLAGVVAALIIVLSGFLLQQTFFG